MHPLKVDEQLIILLALTNGLFDEISIDKIPEAETTLLQNIGDFSTALLKKLYTAQPLSDHDKENILKIATQLLSTFRNTKEGTEKPDHS